MLPVLWDWDHLHSQSHSHSGNSEFPGVLFGGEQLGAAAGAAGFCQRMLLERSIHADAAVTSQTPGVRESRARGGAASWAGLAAVAVEVDTQSDTCFFN